jgi:hypothetical protein
MFDGCERKGFFRNGKHKRGRCEKHAIKTVLAVGMIILCKSSHSCTSIYHKYIYALRIYDEIGKWYFPSLAPTPVSVCTHTWQDVFHRSNQRSRLNFFTVTESLSTSHTTRDHSMEPISDINSRYIIDYVYESYFRWYAWRYLDLETIREDLAIF